MFLIILQNEMGIIHPPYIYIYNYIAKPAFDSYLIFIISLVMYLIHALD